MTDASDTEGNTIETEVVIIGAGPAGWVLNYLLVRSGVDTVLLECQRSLHREFRGFLFQLLALRVFDQMGVLDRVLSLDYTEVRDIEVVGYDRSYPIMSLDAAPSPYNYALLMEQPPLLQAETFDGAMDEIARVDGQGAASRDMIG